jgi:DNA-binding transcriptional LysR family regulator
LAVSIRVQIAAARWAPASEPAKVADFVTDGIDLAIRCGGGRYPGVTSELLMTEDHFPVCRPKLIKGCPPLRFPADLLHHTLLHDVFNADWTIWLRRARIGMLRQTGDRHSCLLITPYKR